MRSQLLRVIQFTCTISVLLSGQFVHAQLTFDNALKQITEKELKSHVTFLASDTLQGREAGTEGGYAAGSYIVQHLKKSGLTPGDDDDDDFFQYFQQNFRNILAIVPGSDPKLKDEYVLVGAHYDHVGFGNRRNSRGPIGFVHNGADDNASGTAGVLELANALMQLKERPKRSILIAFWDAEEKGLIGSKVFVQSPTLELKKIKLAINADMIGRLRPKSFEFYGWRTALGLRDWATRQNTSKLHIKFSYEFRPDSDHWPFFEQGIPSVMVHSGRHEDYHRPSDDPDKVNFAGIEQIARYTFRLAYSAANMDAIPEFRRESKTELRGLASLLDRFRSQNRPLRLGIKYDADLSQERIVKITSVRAESPAAKGNLMPGDEIVSFGGKPVKDYENFNTLVVAAKSPADVVIRRDDKEMTLKIELAGKHYRIGVQWQTDKAEPNKFIVTDVVNASAAQEAGLAAKQRIIEVPGTVAKDGEELKHLLLETPNPVEITVEEFGYIRKLKLNRIE